jgi:predicted nucleic acid-binding protein
MSNPQPVIFMLDTNILVKWMRSYMDDMNPSNLRIREFCENTHQPIVIPDIVWLELISFFVHKNIKLGVDWEETVRNFRDKQTLVQQLEQLIRNRPNWTFLWHPKIYDTPFKNATRLMQDHKLLDEHQFNRMVKRAEKKYEKDSPKLLDGLDSAILMYVNEIALANPNAQVILYTADYPLSCIANSHSWKEQAWIARNFKSVYSLHRTLRCRTCRWDNPTTVLYTPDMWCGNPGKPSHRIKL